MTGAPVSLKKNSDPAGRNPAITYFLDTNIFMYASGAPSPHKSICLKILEDAAAGIHMMKTSAEVAQEVLHRYSLIGRREFGIDLVGKILVAFEPVAAVTHPDIELATTLMGRYPSLRSRDAIHAAVALNNGISHIISTDRDFDIIKEITRLDPVEFA